MEAAGLVMSAVATATLLIEVVKVGELYIREIRGWNDESRKLSLRMSVQMENTQAIQNILFGAHDVAPGMPLFERLNYQTKLNVCAMMQEFHDIITLRYKSLKDAYSLAPPSDFDRANTFKISWVLWGKRRVKAAVDECEAWNERLFAVVQLHILSQLPAMMTQDSSTPTSDEVSHLKSNQDIKRLGLEKEIDLAQLSMKEDQDWESLEVLGNIVFEDGSGSLRCGRLRGRRVIVDFKSFYLHPQNFQELAAAEPPPEILNRIRQLAVLLHRQHSVRSRLLRCAGFYRDARRPTFGFIFDFPPGRFNRPISLHRFLELRESRAQCPELERRLKLALTIAVALFQFHAVGWVHKSFRSSNTLFFPENSEELASVPFEEPWLVGFEYAREDPGFSEKNIDVDISNDIYRHPEQWGEPTNRFQKSHDIYSLGVVLLEIGLWEPASRLESKSFTTTEYDERFDVQKLFIKSAKDKLPFMIGRAYTDVVVKCLTGQFDLSEMDDGRSAQEIYQEQVIEALRLISR